MQDRLNECIASYADPGGLSNAGAAYVCGILTNGGTWLAY